MPCPSRMKPMKITAIALVALMLAACATKPVNSASAPPVPPERVLWTDVADGYQIRVTRDSGYNGSLCATRLYVNGKAAADIKPGETVAFAVTAGRNILGAGPSPIDGKMCTAFGSVESMRREVDASGNAGDKLNFRLAINLGPILTPTAF